MRHSRGLWVRKTVPTSWLCVHMLVTGGSTAAGPCLARRRKDGQCQWRPHWPVAVLAELDAALGKLPRGSGCREAADIHCTMRACSPPTASRLLVSISQRESEAQDSKQTRPSGRAGMDAGLPDCDIGLGALTSPTSTGSQASASASVWRSSPWHHLGPATRI